MSSESSLGITPASGYSSSLGVVYNSAFPAKANAGFVGYLSKDSTKINVLGQLDQNISQDYYKFNFTSGDRLKLSFNSVTSSAKATVSNPAGTTTDAVDANLRFQLYDVAGNLVADSGGTDTQKAAYNNLTSSSGLSAANGDYYVKISATPQTSITSEKSYNFQLYSGSTYNTNLSYTALTQSYDPDLFKAAYDTVTSASSLTTYTNSSTLSGKQSSALNIGILDVNKSELYTNSEVNRTNTSAYYSFDFNSGSSIKFNLNNTTSSSVKQSLRVQLYDNKGKIVADSNGTEAQQEAYKKFDSGQGLKAANGKYTIKVSYAPGAYTTSAQTYNFQVYSGNTYDTQYKTTATLPSSNSKAIKYGENLGIFANSNAQLYTRTEFHTIGETAASGPNIGWLNENKAATSVTSQLTHVDGSQFYNFTLQKGSNLKLAFNNQTGTAKTQIQLLDSTGNRVIADNYGTDAQKKAFADLTSSSGLAASPQGYSLKVAYAKGVDTTKSQTYDFKLYSGSSYSSLYKFTVSAQTYQNAVLSGNTKVVKYNPSTAGASLLNSDTNLNVYDILSSSGSASTIA